MDDDDGLGPGLVMSLFCGVCSCSYSHHGDDDDQWWDQCIMVGAGPAVATSDQGPVPG